MGAQNSRREKKVFQERRERSKERIQKERQEREFGETKFRQVVDIHVKRVMRRLSQTSDRIQVCVSPPDDKDLHKFVIARLQQNGLIVVVKPHSWTVTCKPTDQPTDQSYSLNEFVK
jgi:hypothetical protein